MLIQPIVLAQFDERDFARYTVQDGLCDNAVFSLQQDAKGYLWIGTDAGLNRFDGSTFSAWHQDTEPLQLRSGSIHRLKRFGDRQIGIVSKGGFQLLDVENYHVRDLCIHDTTAFGALLNTAWDADILEDSTWVVTTVTGVYAFDRYARLISRYDAHRIDDIGQKQIRYGREIFNLGTRCVIYVGDTRLGLYDSRTSGYTELNSTDALCDVFLPRKEDGDEHWVVKYQLSRDEFLFIPNHNDVIIYHHFGRGERIVSPLPFEIHQIFSWESQIAVLNDSTLLVNDRTNGFYILQINKATGRIFCDGRKYLPGYKVLSMFADRDSRLWIGTTEGLLMQQLFPPLIRAYAYPPAHGEKHTGGFTGVYRHRNVLYATRFSQTHGLALIDPASMQLIREVTIDDTASAWNEIRSVEMYHPDTLWLGTNAGLLWYDTYSGRYGRVLDTEEHPWAAEFYPVFGPPGADGYAWMCSMLNGKVVRYHIASRTFEVFTRDTDPALPFDRVKHVVRDVFGDVWVGGHSLACWNNRTQTFDTLISVYGGREKYSEDIISMTSDAHGSLWLHNAYNGILAYRIREKHFESYGLNDGMPTNVFRALSPIIQDKLWIAANNHLVLMDVRDKQITVFDHADGLPESRPTSRRMYYDSVSALQYLGSGDFLVTVPAVPPPQPDTGGELFIESVSAHNGRTLHWPDGPIRLHSRERSVQIVFGLVDFNNDNYQFAYRLHEDEEWHSIGTQRTLTVSNLASGTYTLEIRATGHPGIEKHTAIWLTIPAPLWRRSWFQLLTVCILIAGLWSAYSYRLKLVSRKANIDRLLVESEMKALQTQMNPHFIFNSLNSIGEMILNRENKEASHYLSKFARLIRMTLEQSTMPNVSLRTTLDYLDRYIEMERIRNGFFTSEVHVDPDLDLDDTALPPMVLQPFIENALWHGVTATRRDIHVRIDFLRSGDAIVCRIDDNGAGVRQSIAGKSPFDSGHQSVGIANIQNRIALLNEKYGLKCRVDIQDKSDLNGGAQSGTLVTLHLPLELDET